MHLILVEIFTTVLGTISAFIPIANPLATVVILPVIAAHLTPQQRCRYYMAAILVVFLLAGALLMDFSAYQFRGCVLPVV